MSAPPDALFHYTTLPGIIGIAQNKTLWATSIRHLADAKEFSYAHQMLADAIKTKASDSTHDVAATIDALLFHLTRVGDSKLSFSGSLGSIFVTSFSCENDLLSQWRAYCPSGGYALGFRTDILMAQAAEQGFELRQCSYDADEHRRECDKIAAEVIRLVGDIPIATRKSLRGAPAKISFEALGDLYPIERWMVNEIQRHAPVWKHPSFREEAEWRLVSMTRERRISFRAGRTAIVPYVEFRIDGDASKAGEFFAILSNTVVGPCPEPELAVGSAMDLFGQSKIAAQSFSLSNTPYRSW
jgi:Protein of unknown function (DUF2971)